MLKRDKYLLGFVLILFIIICFVYLGGLLKSEGVMMGRVSEDAVAKMVVVEKGRSYTLTRGGEGNDWLVELGGIYDSRNDLFTMYASQEKVKTFVDKLISKRKLELISEIPFDSRYGLSEATNRVDFFLYNRDDKLLRVLRLGKKSPLEKHFYCKFGSASGERKEIYQIPDIFESAITKQGRYFVEDRVFNFDFNAITEVTFKTKQETEAPVLFKKKLDKKIVDKQKKKREAPEAKKTHEWTDAKGVIYGEGIDSFLIQITSLKSRGFLRKNKSFYQTKNKELARMEIKTQEGVYCLVLVEKNAKEIGVFDYVCYAEISNEEKAENSSKRITPRTYVFNVDNHVGIALMAGAKHFLPKEKK